MDQNEFDAMMAKINAVTGEAPAADGTLSAGAYIASSIAGRYAGGPAKVSVFASALFVNTSFWGSN